MKNKVIFRYITEYPTETFLNSKCLLTISVGQDVHEGDKFEATVNLINASFKSVVLLIGDSLQRHAMALNTPNDAEYYFEKAQCEGDLWLKRNAKYIKQIKKLVDVVRWNKWLSHEKYMENKNLILERIRQDDIYKEAFEGTIDNFLSRFFERHISNILIDHDKARKLCFNYLVEECAAMTLWPELSCEFEVYPSRRNLAMASTYENFILPACPNLLRPIGLKFKNKKPSMPQNFNFSREEAIS